MVFLGFYGACYAILLYTRCTGCVLTFIVINYYGRIQNPSETIRNCEIVCPTRGFGAALQLQYYVAIYEVVFNDKNHDFN